MLTLKKMCKMSAVVSAVSVTLFAAVLFAEPEKTIEVERFIEPDTCSGCHFDIFQQWENSMHNLSHRDPVYSRVAKFLRKGLKDREEIEEAESCVKCHTPMGFVTGFPRRVSDDWSRTPDIATRGIQCDYCHSVTDVKQIYNNGLVVEPGNGEDDPGIKYGPFDDAMPDFHEAAYSRLHTESRICGTCHDVKHVVFGTNLETTYTEWKNGPYNSEDPDKRVTCQGCHMYQRPGVPATGATERPANPGSAADYSEERPHIFTHYFVGANASVPAGFGAETKSRMAVERLQHAAALSVDTSMISQKRLAVTVENTGAGHCIPTGVSDLRQVWLEITVKSRENQTVFQSGVLDENRILPDEAVVFRTVFGDKAGNRVINLSKAAQILKDNRIKPKQRVTETFELPTVPEQGCEISVRLLYRSMPRKILNMVPGQSFDPLPVIEMAALRKTI